MYNSYIDKVTIVITVFNRKKQLKNLLDSIKTLFGNNVKVMIADDSFYCLKETFAENIKYMYFGFDKGLNYKRNRLIESVETEFFILLEEDMILFDEEGIITGIKYISEHGLDLLGGVVLNYYRPNLVNLVVAIKKIFTNKNNRFDRLMRIINQSPEIINFYGHYDENNNLIWNKEVLNMNKVYNFDFYPNFFIARTQSILEMKGWQPETIKIRGEHGIFFRDFKNSHLRSSLHTKLKVKHYPTKSLIYLFFRMRNF